MSDVKRSKPMDARLRKTLAKLLAGLQVPCSLHALGTALEPYNELRAMFKCFGWQKPQEIERDILNWEEDRTK